MTLAPRHGTVMARMELADFVRDFATALKAVDARRPVFTSRTGRVYKPGIGPHSEDRAVDLILEEMKNVSPHGYGRFVCRVPYARSRQTCDVVLPNEWMIEVKMARFYGDNNKPDDTSLKDLLSPFDVDRSALTDCAKLAAADGPARKAIVIYGFDYPAWPMDPVIEAFEVRARVPVRLGERCEASFTDLIHPVHQRGRTFGWEVPAKIAGELHT